MHHSDSMILQALHINITFAHLMIEQREKSGLQASAFAEKLGISANRLTNIEKGKVDVLPADAAEYAKILKQSEEQFVRLALQDMIDRAGLNYTLILEAKKI